MTRRSLKVVAILMLAACATPATPRSTTKDYRALGDTLLTLFDSMIAIHQAIPDTALLRRVSPAVGTILFVEGPQVHQFTGDSLVRRVAAAHRGVTSMGPAIDQRVIQFLGPDHAMLTGHETVTWTMGTETQQWEGLLTLVAERGEGRWVVRGYRH